MPYKKTWDWEQAAEGMRVFVVDFERRQIIDGVIKCVRKTIKHCRINGMPNHSLWVGSVTVLDDNGFMIVVERNNRNYQIVLR